VLLPKALITLISELPFLVRLLTFRFWVLAMVS
jgi:hypothetical protein